jgi:osmotically-inducible protein OsmY
MTPRAVAPETVRVQPPNRGAAVSDRTLENAVREALAGNRRLHADGIAVEADDGTVVLRGTVGSVVRKAEAARAARRVLGARTVDDQLRVRLVSIDRPDHDTEAPVLDGTTPIHDQPNLRVTVRADDIARRVTDAIGADALVGIDNVTVRVQDNNVTLGGWVTSLQHHDAALDAAQNAPGVAHVRDEMNLRPRQ